MPYIKREKRGELDPLIKQLVDKLSREPVEEVDGQLNYVIFKLILGVYKPPRYFNYNRAMGVLASVMQEFYRRVVAAYEDKKMSEEGDIL